MILAVTVLFSSTGFTVYKHYCGDFLKDVSVFETDTNCHEKLQIAIDNNCGIHTAVCSEMNAEDDWCKNESNRLEIKDNFKKLIHSTFKLQIPLIVKTKAIVSRAKILPNELISASCFIEASPKIYIPKYILNNQFNFYG